MTSASVGIQEEPPSSLPFPLATRSLSLHKDYDNNSQRVSSELGCGNRDRQCHRTEQSRAHPEGNTLSAPDERQEFFTGLWIFPEYPQHCAGYCFTVHFLYPTHYHTHVPRRNERGVSASGTLLGKEQSLGERCFLHGHIQFWEGNKTSTSRKGNCSTSAVEESHILSQ